MEIKVAYRESLKHLIFRQDLEVKVVYCEAQSLVNRSVERSMQLYF